MKTKMLLLFLICLFVLSCAKDVYKNGTYKRDFKGCHFFTKGRDKQTKNILPKKTTRKIKRNKRGKTPKSYERW